MDKFNNQFATQKLRQEMSVTSAGATFSPGPGEQVPQVATKKVSKKKTKKEVKDVEPKYAAGKAKVYPKEKWGWKDAPSIPNRPSKGGFIYKQLFEELSEFVNEIDNNDPVLDRPIYKDWDEFVNPHYIIVHLNDGKKLKISRNRVKGGDAVYHAILKAFNDNNYKITNKVVSAMLDKLGEPIKEEYTETNEQREPLEIDDVVKVVYGNQFYGKIGKIMDIRGGFVIVGFMYDEDGEYLDWDESLEDDREIDVEEYSMHSSDVEKIDGEDGPVSDYGRYRQDPDYYEKDYQEKGTSDYFQRRGLDEEIEFKVGDKVKHENQDWTIEKILDNGGYRLKHSKGLPSVNVSSGDLKRQNKLNENYSKFKNETKTRGKSDQFHQAVRQVKKKVQEINRLFEYVSRLKMELSEGEDGLKYKVHTEKALEKIKEMVSALNQSVKKFK